MIEKLVFYVWLDVGEYEDLGFWCELLCQYVFVWCCYKYVVVVGIVKCRDDCFDFQFVVVVFYCSVCVGFVGGFLKYVLVFGECVEIDCQV